MSVFNETRSALTIHDLFKIALKYLLYSFSVRVSAKYADNLYENITVRKQTAPKSEVCLRFKPWGLR